MKIRWFVLFAMLGVACLGQIAEAKKKGGGPKEFTGAKVENDAISVGVTKITLKPTGEMSVALLVQSKSDRELDVDLKGFVLSAGGHEHQREAKALKFATEKVKKGKPKTIKFDFKDIDASITEASLKLSAVFRLSGDKKDQELPDLALKLKGAPEGSAGGEAKTEESKPE